MQAASKIDVASVHTCWRGHSLVLEGQVSQPCLHHQPTQAVGKENEVLVGCADVTDDGVHTTYLHGNAKVSSMAPGLDMLPVADTKL